MHCFSVTGRSMASGMTLVGLLVSSCLMLPSRSLRAQDVLVESALAIAPEDAAFFSTSLNLRQSYEEFVQGNFVKRLRAVPFVRRIEAEVRERWEQPDGELEQAKRFLESPLAKDLMELGGDMSSSEIFVYGHDDWCDAISSIMSLQNEITALANRDDGAQAINEYIMNLTADDLVDLRVPTTVIGFRLSDDSIAREQLDALEGVIRFGLGSADEFKALVSNLRSPRFRARSIALIVPGCLIAPGYRARK